MLTGDLDARVGSNGVRPAAARIFYRTLQTAVGGGTRMQFCQEIDQKLAGRGPARQGNRPAAVRPIVFYHLNFTPVPE